MPDNQFPNVSANTGGAMGSSPQGWNEDFSGQLNDILAPYKQIAQQMYSPYATMRPNSWLARNHPQLAGMLDNAFLTIGSTPQPQGPEGFGGGLSRMMQGLMGAQQYKRQQVMQQAMLPYQMAMSQLQAADISSQIGERRYKAPLEMALTGKAMKQGDMYVDLERHRQEMEDIDRQKMEGAINPAMLMHRRALIQAGLPPDADINKATPDQLEKYGQALDTIQRKNAPAGSYEEQIFNMQHSPDPAVREMGNKAYEQHINTLRAGAGARAEGTEGATQPAKDLKSFMDTEKASRYDDINQRSMTMDAFERASDPLGNVYGYGPDRMKRLQDAYSNYTKGINQEKTQRDTLWNQYERSGVAMQGTGFHEWRANPSKFSQKPPAVGDVVNGFRYKGGDLNSKDSWEAAGQ